MSQHSDWKALAGTVVYFMGGIGLSLYYSFKMATDAAEYQSLYSHLPHGDRPRMITFKSLSRIPYFVAGTFIYMGGLAALSYAMGLPITIRKRLLQQTSLEMERDAAKVAQDATKVAQDATKVAQDATKVAQDATKVAQDTARVISDPQLRQLRVLSTMKYWNLSEEMIREAEEMIKQKKLVAESARE